MIEVGDIARVVMTQTLVKVLHIETVQHETQPTTLVVYTDHGEFDIYELVPCE